MKESTLIEMKNRIEILGNAVNRALFELEQLKTLSVGNMELLKLMDGYQDALERMKEKQEAAKDNSEGLENFDKTQ